MHNGWNLNPRARLGCCLYKCHHCYSTCIWHLLVNRRWAKGGLFKYRKWKNVKLLLQVCYYNWWVYLVCLQLVSSWLVPGYKKNLLVFGQCVHGRCVCISCCDIRLIVNPWLADHLNWLSDQVCFYGLVWLPVVIWHIWSFHPANIKAIASMCDRIYSVFPGCGHSSVMLYCCDIP